MSSNTVVSDSDGERRQLLQKARQVLKDIPCEELFEIPGRPSVVYQLRSYSSTEVSNGASQARVDAPFLFKAFEKGQLNPKRMARLHGGKARQSTIHEYLDWTATAREPVADGDLDFGGFRFILLFSRYRPQWPPPHTRALDGFKVHPRLGAPLPPIPKLMVGGKAVCAATIRSGVGYLEVPFFATKETMRGKGYARALLEAIEDVARACDLSLLLLCSSEEQTIVDLWRHLGFTITTPLDLESFGVEEGELLHMQSTCQMHKQVPASKKFRAVMIKHQHFRQRVYAMCPTTPAQGDSKDRPAQGNINDRPRQGNSKDKLAQGTSKDRKKK